MLDLSSTAGRYNLGNLHEMLGMNRTCLSDRFGSVPACRGRR